MRRQCSPFGSFGSNGGGIEEAALHRNMKNSMLFASPRPHLHLPKNESQDSLEGIMNQPAKALLDCPLENASGSLTTVSAAFSIGSALLGTGLAVPYAFMKASNAVSLALLSLVALVNAIGVRCVAQALDSQACLDMACLEKVPVQNRELSFLAFCAFRQKGRVFASAVLSMELWCALLVSFVSIGIHGCLLTHGLLSQTAVIVITACVLFPLLEAPAWLLGGAGALCLACVAVCIVALAVEAAHADAGPASTLDMVPGALQMVSAAGVFFYNYGNAACLPMIKGEMANSRAFEPVTRLAIVGSCLFYASLGLLGAQFGDRVGQSYLQNIANPTALFVACSAVVVSMLLVMPLLTRPILMASLPLIDATTDNQVFLFKLVFLTISAIASVFLQDELAAISAFTGASLTMCTCVLLPVAIYWKLCWPSLIERCLLVVLFGFGTIFSVAGTFAATLDLLSGETA